MKTFESLKNDYIDESYDLFINGEWVKAEGGKTFTVTSPVNGEPLCTCAESSANDVDKAVKAAWAAFDSFKRTSVDDRAALLERIAAAMEANKDRLAMAECLDTGKLYKYALANVNFANHILPILRRYHPRI